LLANDPALVGNKLATQWPAPPQNLKMYLNLEEESSDQSDFWSIPLLNSMKWLTSNSRDDDDMAVQESKSDEDQLANSFDVVLMKWNSELIL
jgi:hypothetical protein